MKKQTLTITQTLKSCLIFYNFCPFLRKCWKTEECSRPKAFKPNKIEGNSNKDLRAIYCFLTCLQDEDVLNRGENNNECSNNVEI